MPTVTQLVCTAPWCDSPTRKPQRYINKTPFCTRCYQHLWSQSRKQGKTITEMEQLLQDGLVEAPIRFPQLDKVVPCPRRGCARELHPNDPGAVMRRIGTIFICTYCYQSAWLLSQEMNIAIEVAWKQLNVLDGVGYGHKPVECCLPWCKRRSRLSEMDQTDHGPICKSCRLYLESLASRPSFGGLSWLKLVDTVFCRSRLFVPAPGEDEFCSASWCNRLVVRGVECHRGPNEEPICNADGMYFYNYSKRKNISFDEAFRRAPPPQRNGPQRK